MPQNLPPAILLMGPTASGKTAVALALAQRLPIEIISVDSAQVFRDMNIGTAKPNAQERASCPHHLIDIVSPEDTYSAARFHHDAQKHLDDITLRNKIPVLVGGTMLYFKALREGLSDLPDANPHIRAQIDAEAQTRGWPAMHAELSQHDPHTAQRLAPNDSQRIQRALEVIRLTGRPLGDHFATPRTHTHSHRFIGIGLTPSDRSMLHRRIADRFDAMLAAGLVDELSNLRNTYPLHAGLPSMRCVGYRQAWDFLDGIYGKNDLREKGIAATRQLAKRQLTWLRSTADLTLFDCLAPHLADSIFQHIQDAL